MQVITVLSTGETKAYTVQDGVFFKEGSRLSLPFFIGPGSVQRIIANIPQEHWNIGSTLCILLVCGLADAHAIDICAHSLNASSLFMYSVIVVKRSLSYD